MYTAGGTHYYIAQPIGTRNCGRLRNRGCDCELYILIFYGASWSEYLIHVRRRECIAPPVIFWSGVVMYSVRTGICFKLFSNSHTVKTMIFVYHERNMQGQPKNQNVIGQVNMNISIIRSESTYSRLLNLEYIKGSRPSESDLLGKLEWIS
jgi:hypothetical protein